MVSAGALAPSADSRSASQVGLGLHPRVVLDRDPDVVQHPVQVLLQPGQRHVAGPAVDLDVRPGLGQLVVPGSAGLQRADHLAQRPGHVPADQQLRVHDAVAGHAVPGQLHGHRVDQERHVVGDDVDHRGGRVERGHRAALADLDQGPALRPVGGQPGLGHGHRGHRPGPGAGQVLIRDVPVVGAQVAEQVADAYLARLRCRPGRLGQFGRLGQQRIPVIRHM